MSKLLTPYCWLFSHVHEEHPNKPGWMQIKCSRCGRDSFKPYPWQYIRPKTQRGLVWLANSIESKGSSPTNWPPYRRVESKYLKNLGTEHSCDAYSYEHLKGLAEQYRNDGLPELTVERLLSEEGWVSITEDNAEQMVGEINASMEHEANRQEREATMKLVKGDE